MKNRPYVLIVLATFVVLVGVFFYQTLLSGRLPVPTDTLVGLYHPWRDLYVDAYPRGVPFKNFLITDPVRQQIPWRKIGIDAIKTGRLPTWNPYNFAGVPLDANIQAAVFYPFNILFFLFSFPVAWTILIILQPILAGIFMFYYLLSLKRTPLAAIFGSFVWSFCGFSIAWMSWGTMVHAALWLPLILLGTDRILTVTKEKQLGRWYGITSVALAMMMLAGHAQIALYGFVTAVVYAAWRIYDHKHSFLISRRKIKLIWVAAISLVVSAPAWIPLLQYIPDTVRIAARESGNVPGWFLPWQHVIQFVAPDFFGNPSTLNYWGEWNYGEFIGYIGLVPLALSLSCLFAGGVTTFWTWMIIGGLFFMLPHLFTHLLTNLHIPLLGVLQPTRLMMIVDFGLAILASYGFDKVLSGSYKRVVLTSSILALSVAGMWIIVLSLPYWSHDIHLIEHVLVSRRNLVVPTIVCGLLLVWSGFAVRFKKKNLALLGVLLLLTALDLYRFGWKFLPFTDPKYFFPTTGVIAFLQKQPKPFRIASVDDRIMPPNVTGYFGIESIEGYDPLAPKRYQDFLVVSGRGKSDLSEPTGFNRIYTTHNVDSPLFPLLNVRYVLSIDPISSPLLKLVFTEGETHVYEYIHALPRIYLAEHITVADTKKSEEVLGVVLSDSQKSAHAAVLESPVSVLSVPLSGDESVSIDSYEDNRITLTSRTSNPRVLVILNRFDSTTRATVDGKRSTLFRVNYLFSGLVVPAGSHTTVLNY